VLTGSFGSGKTTLLRRVLADSAMRKTAVAFDEFGETGLDHLLVAPCPGDKWPRRSCTPEAAGAGCSRLHFSAEPAVAHGSRARPRSISRNR
jgi:hypothetical protein